MSSGRKKALSYYIEKCMCVVGVIAILSPLLILPAFSGEGEVRIMVFVGLGATVSPLGLAMLVIAGVMHLVRVGRKKPWSYYIVKCICVVGVIATLSPLLILIVCIPIESIYGPYEPSLTAIFFFGVITTVFPFGLAMLGIVGAIYVVRVGLQWFRSCRDGQ